MSLTKPNKQTIQGTSLFVNLPATYHTNDKTFWNSAHKLRHQNDFTSWLFSVLLLAFFLFSIFGNTAAGASFVKLIQDQSKSLVFVSYWLCSGVTVSLWWTVHELYEQFDRISSVIFFWIPATVLSFCSNSFAAALCLSLSPHN